MRWLASAVLWAVIFSQHPQMRLVPPRLELHADSSGFASGRIQVLNSGGEPLDIRQVVPSCKCASATVLKNPVYPLEVGEILVRVNTQQWKDTVGTVELEIETNVARQPTRYTVIVRRTP
ncbi:MAG: DUF1573 domain-containing protein [Bacteroidota bacterium]|nr:DUF1573 domain-containing protein [Candidatus Kapabacteria bacterium]MDW8075612.1 DUF1573 domain-containing protein [Bacteroidota bacterium]MDW8272115.1 DUF1573 domain-containing protein [Bacteroidota bacterium]